jgi:hypothetical protein
MEILPQNITEETEENHKTPYLGYPISRERFEPSISRVRSSALPPDQLLRSKQCKRG